MEKRFGDNDAIAFTKWPYSTHDEISHLGMTDAALLRARIDQLLEERRDLHKRLGVGEVIFPFEWKLTGAERRFMEALVLARREDGTVLKEYLHEAIADSDEPETEIKIVDVICCKIRKKLAPYGIDIEVVWGLGYRLTPEVRKKLRG